MKPLLPLSDLVVDWPVSAPQSLTDVWNCDTDELPESGKELRRHLVDVRNSFDSTPVLSPEDVRSLLERRLLRPLPGAWLVVPLDGSRRRILAPVVTDETLQSVVRAAAAGEVRAVRRHLTSPGSTRWAWSSHVTRHVPSAATLNEYVPLHPKGVYLVVFGGSPAVLDDPQTLGRLSDLLKAVPVADVVFWHLQPSAAPCCFSLGAGRGEQAGDAVEFPCSVENLELLQAALRKEEK